MSKIDECKFGIYEKAFSQDLSLEQILEKAKNMNLDYVELSIDESDKRLERLNWSTAVKKELVRTECNLGIAFESICLSAHRKYPLGSENSELVSKSLDIAQKAIQLAAELGIRTIQLAGYDVYYEEHTAATESRFSENLSKVVGIAAKYGVCLGFETMETPFMNTCEKAMHFVKSLDSPYLQLYPDIGNLSNAAKEYKKSVATDLDSAKGHIVAVHAKETLPGIFRNLSFGDGHTDFTTLIPKCYDMGVRRFVCELWANDNPKWQSNIEKAVATVKKALQ